MRFFQLLFVFLFVVSCKSSDEFVLEKREIIQLKEAEYIFLPSAIKEGPKSYTVTLRIKEKPKSISLQGVYLYAGYTDVKELKDTNVFRGAFTKASTERLDLDTRNKVDEIKTNDTNPFKLETNEAVISFIHKGKLKYQKIPIRKLYSTQIPM